MSKNKPLIITLICLMSIIIILLVAFLVFVIRGSFKFNNINFGGRVSNNLLMDEEYNNDLTNINISTNSADIDVKETNEESIRVLIYADKDKISNYYVNDENNILNINIESKKCNFFCINITKSKVIVYVPNNYDKNITINNNYGDILVGNLKNSNLSINEDCGDVVIGTANEIKVKNSYGDININYANKINIEEDCGDVEVKKVDYATIENNFGNIKINTVNSFIDLEDSCGDIKIENITLNKDSRIINNLGDIEIGNIKDVYIDAKTDLGDIKINNNYHKSDITLKIENDCGDIEVEN